ncbi:hypothetical protein [Aminobacter sp. MET-1]|uniref:hypothetical protein n=1 Tax=Aminobacter sp. MET-1 TaxID=2951085 RepID=UPI00226AC209|nr:hypothetical protein [Aminobacter sp. MET-1]MCX8571140.1 hypothetical protein [Aminobacter sp. MET-1]MCX8573191.1 hypothetical protein [Aminobacter sp. MET-1]
MGWKQDLRVGDLAETQKLEARCLKCGHTRYFTRATMCTSPERQFMRIEEVEEEATCRTRGCNGRIRLSMVRLDELTGFVGGLA